MRLTWNVLLAASILSLLSGCSGKPAENAEKPETKTADAKPEAKAGEKPELKAGEGNLNANPEHAAKPETKGEVASEKPTAQKPSDETPPIATEAPLGKKVTTASGLQYEEVTLGKGKVAKPGMTVAVHYLGTFPDGKMFDTSKKPGGEPLIFTLGRRQVIRGWDEGVSGMKVGGKRKLTVPYMLAYGEEGQPPTIPPRATLLFEVELLDVL